MATDNTVLNLGTGGDTIRDIDRGAYKTQVVQLDIGGAAAESLVTGTMPVSGTITGITNPVAVTGTFWQATQPVSGTVAATQSGAWSTGRTWTLASATDSITLGALSYPVSTNNSSTAQLASGAAFTGTIETIQNQQAAQIEVVCDQAYKLTINQYQDAGGTKLTSSDTFVRAAGVPYNENVSLPGNYFNLVLTNNGQSTTSTLSIDTTFGIMATGPRTVTALGNNRMAINEIGGNAVSSSSLPVQITPQQQVDLNSNNLNLLVQQMLSELRINNYLLQQGLNVRDDVDLLRADPYYNPYLNQ